MKTFSYQTKVELFNTDAAGVIFFSQLFHLTHRAFSAFLNAHEISIQKCLQEQDYFLPVVHAEGDYLAPIVTEDLLDIELKVLHMGKTSFTMGYTLLKGHLCVAKAKIVHVTIDAQKEKRELPQKLRKALMKDRIESP